MSNYKTVSYNPYVFDKEHHVSDRILSSEKPVFHTHLVKDNHIILCYHLSINHCLWYCCQKITISMYFQSNIHQSMHFQSILNDSLMFINQNIIRIFIVCKKFYFKINYTFKILCNNVLKIFQFNTKEKKYLVELVS